MFFSKFFTTLLYKRMNNSVYNSHFRQLHRWLGQVQQFTNLSPSQLLSLSLFPLILVVGHFYQLISSHDLLINYYSNKNNLINKYIVKNGWGWTVLLYLILVYRSHRSLKDKLRSLLRFTLATTWWFTFTQWFFGSPIMDRFFIWTGGYCENLEHIFSSYHCRRLGGVWTGGSDPSGHIFLLSLSSLLLFHEMSKLRSRHWFIWCFIALLLWMFLITSIHFHSLFEKIVGLAWCYLIILLVYLI